MFTAAVVYNMITGDLRKSLGRAAAKPCVEQESAYYLAHIGGIQSAGDFLASDRLYRYAMKAHGLEDMIYARAFMRKVLEEGAQAAGSFALQLSDTRYRDFAVAFDFAGLGAAATRTFAAQQGTVEKYVRQVLEDDTGTQNEGARLALQFERKAPGVTSAYDILADTELLRVVQVAFSIPDELALLDIDQQAAVIRAFLNIDDLRNREKLSAFLNRFTMCWQEPAHEAPRQTPVPYQDNREIRYKGN